VKRDTLYLLGKVFALVVAGFGGFGISYLAGTYSVFFFVLVIPLLTIAMCLFYLPDYFLEIWKMRER